MGDAEIAHISLLETERDGLRLMVADLERRLAATAEERDSWKWGGEMLALQFKALQRDIQGDIDQWVKTLTMKVKDLQREVDQWVKDSAVSQRRIETLERQLADARAEIARLLDVAQKEPHTAYLEAVQRACDERMVVLKHEAREAVARLAELTKQKE